MSLAAGVEVRSEQPADRAAVRGVHILAFGRPDEADLVEHLRGRVDPSISLVAAQGGVVVGHVFFSPVRIDGGGSVSGALALGPLGVLPSHQRAGVGSLLVRAGMRACHELGEDVVFVLGNPAYYARFGFETAGPHGLHYREASPDPSFMVAELDPGALRGRRGRVRYDGAFEGV